MRIIYMNFYLVKIVITSFLSGCFLPVFAQSANYSWAKSMGGAGTERSNSIAVDVNGNVYVAGYFNDSADFDPGVGIATLTPVGSNDIFVAKYDANGQYLWAKSIGGSGADVANSIAIDITGNVYVTGYFNGSVDFDPDAGTATLNSAGASDVFLAKYDSSGQYLWAKSMGGSGADWGNGVTVDEARNVYVAGHFSAGSNINFDPDAGTAPLTSAGGNDVFFAKYDSNGKYLWVKSMGGSGADRANSITIDIIGNVHITGYFNGSVDFDPDAGITTLNSVGSNDVFIAKYDSSGKYLWAKSMGGSGNDIGLSAMVGTNGSVYVTGYFSSSMNIDTGAGTVTLTSVWANDVFIAKYDSNGKYLWAKSMGGSRNDQGNGIAVDGSGNVYVTGQFADTVDFDPSTGAGTAKLISTGGTSDVFIAKYDSSGKYLWAKSMGSIGVDIANSIAINSIGNVYATGYFSGSVYFNPESGIDTLTTAGGNDVFVLKLHQECQVSSTFMKSICDSFIFNGTIYTTSGIYVDTFTTSTNCDSIVTLDLTITGYTAANPVVSGQYCDSVTFNGQTYTSSGTYVQHYTNAGDCDSNVTYDLIISSSPIASVANSENTLTANDADSYQWINCDDNSIISGATGQSYTVTETGNYAVIITTNNCSDTSDCLNINTLNINNNTWNPVINIYPNPNEGRFFIMAPKELRNASINIVDILGRSIRTAVNLSGNTFAFDITNHAAGVYFIEIEDAGKIFRSKLVKE